MREWSLENEVERFVSEARKRQDKKDKTNEEWRRQEKEKLIEEKPKKINGNELEEELKDRKQKRLKIGMNEVEKAATMMEENEIVVLVETWVMEDKVEITCERLSKEFKWWAKPATREKQRGRAKGGHIIGIKKNCKLKWEVREWKYGMMLEESKESESIITVYNNVGMSKLETELRRQIEECANRDESVMIIGDFNARIGEENVTGEDEGRVKKKRKSRDKTVNSEGKKLLKMCDELGLCVWNGRARGDEGGEITYVGGDEESLGSVIDLILTLDRGDEQEIEVRVVERIESDHLPVLARYKVKRNEEESKEGSCMSEEEEQEEIGANKLIWKKEKIQEYAEATQEGLTEAVEEKNELKWEDIKEIVRKGAEKTGMVMKGKKDKDTKEKKKWYNIEGKKKEKKFRGRKKRAASNSIKAKQWEKHFSDLLNGEGNEESEEEENEPWKGEGSNEGSEEPKLDKNFSRREVKAAIRKLGNHKAPGEDGMAAEFIKNSAPDVIEWIGEIINRIWDEGSMPE
ncbi:golgin subfamily A member 6-like protein 22 [Microplitis demolitor]|uniref:golgin subfamily A member 6-like protein 22 n=1 Tax=Microplitis demolitor TaxID=69319 RepID=UPI00235B5CB6|nr:golgin subfamily A member 6-like protein 22 [Microplitis demolitor]